MDNSEQKIVSAYSDYIVNNHYLSQSARNNGMNKDELFNAIIDNGLLFKSKIVNTEPMAFLMGDEYVELDHNIDYRDTYVGMELIQILQTSVELDELSDIVKELLSEREHYYDKFNNVIWRN